MAFNRNSIGAILTAAALTMMTVAGTAAFDESATLAPR